MPGVVLYVLMQASSSPVPIRVTRQMGLFILPTELEMHNSFVLIGEGRLEQSGLKESCHLKFPVRFHLNQIKRLIACR